MAFIVDLILKDLLLILKDLLPILRKLYKQYLKRGTTLKESVLYLLPVIVYITGSYIRVGILSYSGYNLTGRKPLF